MRRRAETLKIDHWSIFLVENTTIITIQMLILMLESISLLRMVPILILMLILMHCFAQLGCEGSRAHPSQHQFCFINATQGTDAENRPLVDFSGWKYNNNHHTNANINVRINSITKNGADTNTDANTDALLCTAWL